MQGFTIWLSGPATGLGAAVAARLTDIGFRTELLPDHDVLALAGDAATASAVLEYLAARLAAHRVVVIVESAGHPADRWPDLIVATGAPGPLTNLAVDVGQCGLPGAVEQVLHELSESNLTDGDDAQGAVLDRLKSIGYLG
jgi:hypothetical protein